MSVESVMRFLQEVELDSKLQEELQGISLEEKTALSIERGAELGFDFGADELAEVGQIHQFWEHAAQDVDLKAKLGALESPKTVVASVVALAQSAGFDFSANSLATVLQLQRETDEDGELSVDELDGVAGGRGKRSFGSISDGTSNTIMMGERIGAAKLSFFRSWFRY